MNGSMNRLSTAIFIFLLLGGSAQAADYFIDQTQEKLQKRWNEDSYLQNLREMQNKAEMELLAEESRRAQVSADLAPESSVSLPDAPQLVLLAASLPETRLEANYIVSTQYLNSGHPADGALNNVYGAPTWVVPRENALAILALIQANQQTGDASYLATAQKAAGYLVRVQDADGGWFDQYSYQNPALFSKSPTQTAEVMMALKKLGYDPARYAAMKKGAEFLISLQNVANKTGQDDGLIGGGKKADGTYQTWRWASDNAFGYQALKAAEEWANLSQDSVFAAKANQAASKVLNGINNYLYISNSRDADYGVWRRAIDERGRTAAAGVRDWINYAPQMLDLPALGVGQARVGEWIHKNLQKSDGSVVWDDRNFKGRKSPGYSFQAALVWLDLGQTQYANAALNWARNSGLWQTTPDANGISGGWIDWIQGSSMAQQWERFIDTSFYYLAAASGGYNFR